MSRMRRLRRPRFLLSAVVPLLVAMVATGCGPPPCRWLVSSGGQSSYTTYASDPSRTPFASLKLGNPFGDHTRSIATGGYTDFTGDWRSDVFRALGPRGGGANWERWDGTKWHYMAYGNEGSTLRFGDFNGDQVTDVFTTEEITIGNYKWLVSYSGTSNYQQLNTVNRRFDQVALGDFNGDRKTDVLIDTYVNAQPQLAYSPGGTGALVPLARGVELNLFYQRPLGDFNGDGKTDVFVSIAQAGGGYKWAWLDGGNEPLRLLSDAVHPQSYADVRLGDFNGDGRTDVFVTNTRRDGLQQWAYSPSGNGTLVGLAYDSRGIRDLHFGYFSVNGVDDGKTDVMAVAC